MISYQLTSDNELIVHGTMQPGEKLPSMCCKGHMWEVSEIFTDNNPLDVSVWGTCENPECPVEADSHWHGISNHLQVDIAAHLLDMVDAAGGE